MRMFADYIKAEAPGIHLVCSPTRTQVPRFRGHGDALLECAEVEGAVIRNAMGSATGLFLQTGCRVTGLSIDYEIGTDSLGVSKLAVIDVDRADVEQSRWPSHIGPPDARVRQFPKWRSIRRVLLRSA